MKEIGQILRKAREDKNLTLDDVHDKTHITVHYLKAVEAGDMSVFSAEVYYTGTLRRYADFLSLNGSELVNMYHSTLAEKKAEAEAEAKPKKEQAVTRNRELWWAAAGLLAVVLGVWLVMSLRGRHPLPSSQPVAVSTATASAVIPSTSTPAVSTAAVPDTAFPAVSTAPSAAAPAVENRKLRLEVTARQDTWVKVTADGSISFEGPVLAGMSRIWGADRRIQLMVGYVPGIAATLNGKPVDLTKGARNDVNEIILTPEALR